MENVDLLEDAHVVLKTHIDNRRLIAELQMQEIDLQFNLNNELRAKRKEFGFTTTLSQEYPLGKYISFLEKALIECKLAELRKSQPVLPPPAPIVSSITQVESEPINIPMMCAEDIWNDL
jgi:hypothetical protein